MAIDPAIALEFWSVGHVDDGELQGDSDLGRGQANAIGVAHGLDHVVRERADFLGHFGDGRAIDAQDGITINDDGQNHETKKMEAGMRNDNA